MSSAALEGFHLQQKGWLGPHTNSRKRGLALLADGSVRFNRRRRNAESQGSGVTPPVFTAGLLAATDRRYREFVAQGGRRLCGGDVACPVRDVSDNRRYSIKLPHDDGVVDRHGVLCSGAGVSAYDCSGAGPPACELESIPSAGASSEATSVQAKEPRNIKKCRLPMVESPKTVQGTRCRRCLARGSRCHLYKRIQWCEQADVPFDEWVMNIFPSKKIASESKTQRRAERIGMQRGRPKKKAIAS